MLTTDPTNPDLDVTDPSTGLQKAYLVLSEDERQKGFVRPYRDAYKHIGVRPKNPLRDLTEDELERYKAFGYVKFEQYPEGPLTGRYWTEQQLGSGCGTWTTMSKALSETYARDPKFYGATYCVGCLKHFPVGEFVWADGEVVGS
jgi:hypothetical protein